jgi:DNA-directed RNA polymerase subunit RPC12/RpoP
MKSYERRLECWQCLRCDHIWQKRPGDRPVTCPGCKNRLWCVAKRRAAGGGRKKVVIVTGNDNGTVSTRPIPHEEVL